MRLTVLLSLLGIGLLSSFFFPRGVNAETNVDVSNNSEGSHTSVNVHTNTGGNTVCVNGQCTTTAGNNGKSTVCINGKCTTSEGDVDVHSDDGNANVHVDNSNTTTNVSQDSDKNSEANVTVDSDNSHIVNPSSTSTPNDKNKKEMKKEGFDMGAFIKGEMDFFKKLLGFGFFGGKEI